MSNVVSEVISSAAKLDNELELVECLFTYLKLIHLPV